MKKCKKVMTKDPVCCLPNDFVVSVAKLMKRENIGSVPVIDNVQTRNLIGIITDRDLAISVVAESRNAKTTKVVEVMKQKVVSCFVDDSLQKAMDAMSENQIRRIPIVDKDNKIQGILSQADVATRGKQPKKTAEMVMEISEDKTK
jgi:CBS domain-containing protein